MTWNGEEGSVTGHRSPATGVEGAMVEMAQQLVRLPLVVWVYTARMFVTTFEGMSRITGEAVGAVARRVEPPAAGQSPAAPPVETGAPPRGAENPKEMRTMPDTNLNDKMVKLVEYTIVSIQRGKEDVVAEAQQTVETDELTGDAFSNARIAEWVTNNSEKAKDLDLEDLRVHYGVVARWPKRDLKFDEKTLAKDEEKTKLLAEIVKGIQDLGKTA